MTGKSPIVVDLKFEPVSVREALKAAFRDREVINLAEPGQERRDLSQAAYAMVWKPHADLFSRASNLKALFSGGAGVDHVMKLNGLPNIPVVRFVDHSLTTRMSEWVVMQALLHLRQHAAYEMQRHDRRWQELPQPTAGDVTIGIMGLGVLGSDAAAKLKRIGFNVIGWSRSLKHIDGVKTFHSAQLDAFLGQTDMLVGLLPLTDATRGIFNATLFAKLREDGALGGPVFINAGRGGSQNERDIVAALGNGTLKAASLDVFETEPLPASSPLWSMANVFMTPHAAAATDVKALCSHVERQIARFESGDAFEHQVDRQSGY